MSAALTCCLSSREHQACILIMVPCLRQMAITGNRNTYVFLLVIICCQMQHYDFTRSPHSSASWASPTHRHSTDWKVNFFVSYKMTWYFIYKEMITILLTTIRSSCIKQLYWTFGYGTVHWNMPFLFKLLSISYFTRHISTFLMQHFVFFCFDCQIHHIFWSSQKWKGGGWRLVFEQFPKYCSTVCSRQVNEPVWHMFLHFTLCNNTWHGTQSVHCSQTVYMTTTMMMMMNDDDDIRSWQVCVFTLSWSVHLCPSPHSCHQVSTAGQSLGSSWPCKEMGCQAVSYLNNLQNNNSNNSQTFGQKLQGSADLLEFLQSYCQRIRLSFQLDHHRGTHSVGIKDCEQAWTTVDRTRNECGH